MNKNIFLLLIGAVLFSGNLFSQITIDSTDINTTVGYTQLFKWKGSATVNLGSAGENQLWDFTNVNAESTQTQKVVSRLNTRYGTQFPLSNYVLQTVNNWTNDTTLSYYHTTAGAVSYNGYAEMGISPNPMVAKYSTEFHAVNLPLSYNQQWNATTHIKVAPFYYQSITLDSLAVNVHVKFQSDGWGRVILTTSDTLEVLRLKHIDTLYAAGYAFGIVFARETLRTINYIYLAKDLGIVCEIASNDGETNPNFTQAATFRAYYGEPLGVKEDAAVANSFTLEQNYPNPFNPTTAIGFSLVGISNVTLKVYNVLGEEVAAILNNKEMEIGGHSVTFDASKIASGVYFYRLIVNDGKKNSYSITRAMVLMK